MRRSRTPWPVIAATTLAVCLAQHVPAATFPVTSDLDDGSVGTLRWAIGQANSTAGPDIITIGQHIITLGSALPAITESVEIAGVSQTSTIVQAGVTYRDGSVTWRVFTTSGAGTSLTLRDLTARHGRDTSGTGGGGILTAGPLVLDGVTLAHNISETASFAAGGGVLANGNLTATDSEISHNTVEFTAASGGGVQGGGISMATNGTTASFVGCTIANNSATTFGSGLAQAGGIFLGGFGAGVTCTLRLCTLSSNQARGVSGTVQGGGLVITPGSTSTVSFDACTITANRAQGGSSTGGGIATGYIADNTGPVIHNTILAGNFATIGPDMVNRVQSRGFNIVGSTASATLDDTGGGNTATGNQVGVTPTRFALDDNGGPTRTHLPKPGSLAVNAGTNLDLGGLPLATDQRGRPRVSGGTADVGAVERDTDAPTIPAGVVLEATTTTDRDVVTFQVTFDESVDGTFDASDVALTGTLAGTTTVVVSGSGPAYTATARMANQYADGTLGLTITGVVSDADGNALAVPVNSATYTIRNVPGDANDDGAVVAAELNTVVLWFRGLLP